MTSPRPRSPGAPGAALLLALGAAFPVDSPGQPTSAPAAGSGRPLAIQIRFWSDATELTGALPDEATADRLRLSVFKARPDHPVHDRLIIDVSRSQLSLPSPDLWAGLLMELSLSTLDGSLTVTPDTFAVSGLTDSLVTYAAVSERLKPLTPAPGGRAVVNRLCLVTAEDLALPQPSRPRPALRPRPLERAPVVLAGADYGPPPAPLQASPVIAAAAEAAATPAPTAGPADFPEAEAADRDSPFEHLETVSFATHSHLVRYHQFGRIDAVIERIRAMTDKPDRIVLRGYADQGGRGEYDRWLGESRAEAVRQAFVDGGVPESRLSIETSPPPPRGKVGYGTVAILIPKPPPAPASAPSPDGTVPPAPQVAAPSSAEVSAAREGSPLNRNAVP